MLFPLLSLLAKRYPDTTSIISLIVLGFFVLLSKYWMIMLPILGILLAIDVCVFYYFARQREANEKAFKDSLD